MKSDLKRMKANNNKVINPEVKFPTEDIFLMRLV